MRTSIKYFVKFFLLVTLGISLLACETAEEPHLSKQSINDDSSSGTDSDYPYNDNQYLDIDDPSIDGYRRAVMTVTVDVNQVAENKSEDLTVPGDPKTSQTEWSFNLSAKQTFQVWVNPDLSILVPDQGSIEDRLFWATSSPFFLTDEEVENSQAFGADGALNYSLTHRSTRPNAADVVKVESQASATGVIKKLEVDNMRPSLYGEGYEFDLKLYWDYQGEDITRLTNREGEIDTLEGVIEPEIPYEPLEITFYPPLNQSKLNNYPIEGEGKYPDLVRQTKDLYREHLEFMNKSPLNLLALAKIRHGARRMATKDSLTLHYQNQDTTDAPMFIAGILQSDAQLIRNLVDVKVDFTLL